MSLGSNLQANFTWTPINDTCRVLECPPPSFSHASLSGGAAPWVDGAVVTVTCDYGFVVRPAATTTSAAADSFVATCVAGTGGPLRVWQYEDSAGTPYTSTTPVCSNRE